MTRKMKFFAYCESRASAAGYSRAALPLSVGLLASLLLFPSPVDAQIPGDPALEFWKTGIVREISRAVDDSFYVGGTFGLAEDVASSGLIKLDSTGDLDFSFQPDISGDIFAVESATGGGVFVGGNFNQINGVDVGRLAKLDSEGNLIEGWSVSADDFVTALRSDGTHLYIGGGFSLLNDQPRSAIARVSAGGGAVDMDFSPTVNGVVADVAVDRDENIWIAGSFDAVNGQPTDNLVVVDSDGAVLRTFTTDADALARSVAVDGSNRVYVCGRFSTIDSQDRAAAARFTVGSEIVLDDWQIETDGLFARCTADVNGVWVGGDMSVVNDLDRKGIARIGADGVVDPDFQASPQGVFTGNPASSARIQAIGQSPTGEMLIGGLFSDVDGLPLAALAAVDGTSGDLTRGYDLERRAEIRSAIARFDDGSLIVGGSFRRAGEVIANNLVRLDADGQIDEDWPLSSNGQVLTSLQLPDGSLIIGGFFSSIGGESRSSIARIEDPAAGKLDVFWQPEVFGAVLNLHVDVLRARHLVFRWVF